MLADKSNFPYGPLEETVSTKVWGPPPKPQPPMGLAMESPRREVTGGTPRTSPRLRNITISKTNIYSVWRGRLMAWAPLPARCLYLLMRMFCNLG